MIASGFVNGRGTSNTGESCAPSISCTHFQQPVNPFTPKGKLQSKPRNFKILNCQTNFVEACDDSKESSLGIHSDGSVHVVGEQSLYFCVEFGQRNISVTGLKV